MIVTIKKNSKFAYNGHRKLIPAVMSLLDPDH